MKIRWFGGNALLIQAKQASIILGWPEKATSSIELKKGDLVILPYSRNELSEKYLALVDKREVFIIDGPGEYSYQEVTILTQPIILKNNKRMIMASLSVQGVVFTSLMDLDRELEGKELDLLTRTDVLVIPVGGEEVLDYRIAIKLINNIEPRAVITTHSQSLEDPDKEPVTTFLKEYGVSIDPIEELIIKKGELSNERTEIYPMIESKA